MSVVTNIILTFPSDSDEEEQRIFRAINEADCFYNDARFVWPTTHDWYGGSKALEVNVLVGAFNHLDVDGLKAHLATLDWYEPENVRLMVCEQSDAAFYVWRLTRKREWSRGDGWDDHYG